MSSLDALTVVRPLHCKTPGCGFKSDLYLYLWAITMGSCWSGQYVPDVAGADTKQTIYSLSFLLLMMSKFVVLAVLLWISIYLLVFVVNIVNTMIDVQLSSNIEVGWFASKYVHSLSVTSRDVWLNCVLDSVCPRFCDNMFKNGDILNY